MTETSRAIADALERLQSESREEREDAVRVLNGATADEALAGLVIALEDEDAGIREFAADSLARCSGETTSLLLSEFLGAENIRTRNLAAEILVRIGGSAVPALVGWIGHADHDVRKFVVDVLGLIGEGSAAEAVCGALWDENINVSCSAAEALGLLAEPSSCEALIAAAEKRAEIRPQAIEALGRIKDPRAVEFLVGFLSSADPLLMYAAAEALGQIGSPQALKALSAVVNDTSVEVAEEAFKSALRISESIRVNLTDHISGERMRRFVMDGLVNADEDILTFALRTNEIWHDAGLVASVIARASDIKPPVLQRVIANFKRLRVQFYEPLFAAMESADTATLNLYLEILKDCHIH
ncbi:MAG TPA: HEAT repeat domain-containing protein, partial [candidate division Zixibacteria bacterium]|nr:HEAT repeat domain-containing protein [candidate division Zixibacteria bacterium]